MDSEERDALASDLAIPITQLAGTLCGMRKYTGASGDAWIKWIDCLDEPTNELGTIFEAAMDGEGAYGRVLGPGTMASLVGSPGAFREHLAGAIAAADSRLMPEAAERIADAVIVAMGNAAQPAEQFVRQMPTEALMAEIQRRVA